ncbi:MAG TPA: acyltransferase [Vicinamibacterales bacterium]|jgi:acetyltransferase-like isoleucine patch superfamily enzyme|nr:acyltransferase [Vicinamibacterales bacterium]
MAPYAHPQALVESDAIGEGTRVWAFAHVMNGAVVGRDCNIGEHCFIEKGAVVGDRVTVKNHVAIWAGITIHDGVFIGPNASLTNDYRPRSRHADWTLSPTEIGEGATIGANATIVCGIEIGPFAFVGAGSVVTRNVAPHALVYGNPARQRGFVCQCAEPLTFKNQQARCRACKRRYRKDRRGNVTMSAAS